jgi:hypothetical protein
MSGGHFNYIQNNLEVVASDIDELIRTNWNYDLDEHGNSIGRGYPIDIIAKFFEARKTIRLAAAMIQRVDWLVSGDDGEDSFRRRWEREVDPLRKD